MEARFLITQKIMAACQKLMDQYTKRGARFYIYDHHRRNCPEAGLQYHCHY